MITNIEFNNVSLAVSTRENPILSGVNYQINEGDFVIVLGSNGSGKSSLLKLLDRRYSSTRGQVSLFQKNVSALTRAELSRDVVTLTQNCHDALFPSLTLLENFLLVKQKSEKRLFAIQTHQEKTFFADYIRAFNPNLSEKLDVTVDKLSGGEKQALALALCVFNPPKILLLDEHTSALDPVTSQQIMELTAKIVKKHHITCLLTTHDLEIAKHYGNRILALKQGKIFQRIEHAEKQALTEKDLAGLCY